MPQVGIYSAYQLGMHNHLNNDNGGILVDYSRFGAFRAPSRLAATLNHTYATMRQTGELVYTLLKQIEVTYLYNYGGTCQIRWQMSTNSAGDDVGSAFFVNDVQVGVDEITNLVAYQNYTHNYDVGLNSGDRLQIWGMRIGGGAAVRCRVQNFAIYYDWRIYHFGDGTSHVCTTPIALSDADDLEVDNTTGY